MKTLPPIPDLVATVWELVRQIPVGSVSTYGLVARALGDVSASRFVGELMLHHDHDDHCVCHRVVRSDGTLGKYVLGIPKQKAKLLRNEGHKIDVVRGKNSSANEQPVYSMPHGYRWADFRCRPPLKSLADFQHSVATSVVIEPFRTDTSELRVAGVDVSFVPRSKFAVAAYTEVDLESGECSYSKTYQREVTFPYISGYLAFRELPLLMDLLDEVRRERSLAEVLVVDGSGLLHPRGAGVAVMLGVTQEIPTVGVTKKHLCGSVDLTELDANEAREVRVNKDVHGFAMLPGSGTQKPIYVSPGHQCDPQSAMSLVKRCRLGKRLPAPIYWADRISRSDARKAASSIDG